MDDYFCFSRIEIFSRVTFALPRLSSSNHINQKISSVVNAARDDAATVSFSLFMIILCPPPQSCACSHANTFLLMGGPFTCVGSPRPGARPFSLQPH